MSNSRARPAHPHSPRAQPQQARFRNHELTAVPTTGVPVAAFTVGASRRVYDPDQDRWKDGDTLFLRCSAWRQLAEHVTESLSKGTRVVVTRRLRQRDDYEASDGQKRTVYEIDADDAGPSLRFAITPGGFADSDGCSNGTQVRGASKKLSASVGSRTGGWPAG